MLLIFEICQVGSSWCALSHSYCWLQTRSGDDWCSWDRRYGHWYFTEHFRSLLCQLCASYGTICAGVQCQKYCVSKVSYQLGQCPRCSHELYWITIFRPADPLVAFDRVIGKIIFQYVPTTVLLSRSGDMQWFGPSCRRAYDAKQTAYRAWYRARNAEHLGQFVLVRA